MNHKKTAGSHSPFVFPPNPGFFGTGAQSAPPPPPFAPYLVPAQTPWAGAATMNNVLTPNHPYLQVFYVFIPTLFRWPIFWKIFAVQVNLCQKHLFSHQLAHNIRDCSLIYQLKTWKLQAQKMGEHVVYTNYFLFWHSEQFL